MDERKKNIVLVVVCAVILLALFFAMSRKNEKKRGYDIGNHQGGFLAALFDNGANIVDAGGRHTSSFVTALTNGVSSIIATKKSGKFYPAEYGYSDERPDYGPYVLAGAMVLTAGVIAALVLIKK